MAVRIDDSLDGIDWTRLKADLAADDFDNGRSPEALRRSFEHSQHVAIARDCDRVVGTARTALGRRVQRESRRRVDGVGISAPGDRDGELRALIERVPGQHVALQTSDAQALYEALGFRPRPEFWSLVAGRRLENDANR